jgi:hypothetical protein
MDTDKHGFPARLSVHLLGEPLVSCKFLASVSIRVHPWLNGGF